jgi:cytosine/adenosine deaminase-related metal-dependent hydrolase
MDFYSPSRVNHGSYYFDWTSHDEIAWRNFYQVWFRLLNDYKKMGGRVTASDDAAYIYNTWGFGYIHELELMQEAGFHPLEVIRGATMHAAQALHEPRNRPIEFGIVRAGLLADMVVVDQNPLQNLKVLYGTGAVRLNARGRHQVHDQGRHRVRRQAAPGRRRGHGREAETRARGRGEEALAR